MAAAETIRWDQGHLMLMWWSRLSCHEPTVPVETRHYILPETGTSSSGGVEQPHKDDYKLSLPPPP